MARLKRMLCSALWKSAQLLDRGTTLLLKWSCALSDGNVEVAEEPGEPEEISDHGVVRPASPVQFTPEAMALRFEVGPRPEVPPPPPLAGSIEERRLRRI